MRRTVAAACVVLGLAVSSGRAGAAEPTREGRLVELGRALFFDSHLSNPAGRACASCHDPKRGFADPDDSRATSRGAVQGRFGGRNAPSAAYARFAPPFHRDPGTGGYVGGLFWDGRADSLEAQAAGPLLNPVEMNQKDAAAVMSVVRTRPYADLFARVFGKAALSDSARGFTAVTQALAAFEKSDALAPFTSKYDAYLRGEVQLSPAEARGLALFENPRRGNCAACHPSRPSPDGAPPLFTDFSYDNLGVPKRDPGAPVDLGLGGRIGVASENGKFRVPTLRNVALTAPYMHNGYFKDLRQVVHFYNTRDVEPGPPPEVPATVNHRELGNLHLSPLEEDDLVAFLQTLTDGYEPAVARR